MGYDKLLMYLGEDFIISDQLIVHQPSIIDIARFGEKHYFNTVYTLCAIPSDYKSELWDLGYNYSKISDFEYFVILSRNISSDDTKLLLGENVSFKDMVPMKNPDNGEFILADSRTGIVIDEFIYSQMIGYIREMHNIYPKRERPANKETLRILIDEDRMKKAKIKKDKKDSDEESFLLPLISSMVNSPGFKYDIASLKNLGIYPFMDSVQRIQAINTAASIRNGLYSGMVDLTKNPNLTKQLNWLRDLSKDPHHNSNVTVTSN